MYIPVNPSFIIKKWDVRGSSLHGLVFVMQDLEANPGVVDLVRLARLPHSFLLMSMME